MVKKILRKILITIISLIVVLILLVLSLQIPFVQNFIKDRLVVYLENKIHTKVELERIYIGFPSSLVMENLYLEGQDVDTLLYVKNFDVGLNILQLVNSKAEINSIDLQGVRANVIRKKDGTFNFDYILNAFATKEEEESESKPFIISLDKIKLKDIGVSFIDRQSANSINGYFKSLDTRIKTFDLEKNSYAAGDIAMDGLRLKLKQDLIEEVSQKVEEKVDSLNAQQPMKLALNGIKLTNFDIGYEDDNTKTFAKAVFKELNTKINSIDVQKNRYDADKIMLKEAYIRADLYLKSDSSGQKSSEPDSETEQSMKLLLGKLHLDDVKVVYNNTAAAPAKQGMDFNHLNFSKLNVDLEDFKMENGTFAGSLKKAEIKESRGLDIQKFNADFVYNDKQAKLENLLLQTPKTILRNRIQLDYNSAEQLSESLGAVQVLADIKDSKIGFSDILMLAPDLRNTAPFNKYPDAVLDIDARTKGTVNDLWIENLQISGIDRLKLAASGNIKNAMNPDKLFYDVHVKDFSSSSKTIENFLPKNTLPDNITLPSYFSVKGTAKGTTQSVNANLALTSTSGNAGIKADVDMSKKNQERYDVLANIQNLQIGNIIGNKELGAVTGQISVKGRSFDFNRANADIKGHITSAEYQNYRYRNIDVKGNIRNKAYHIDLDSKDPNANLNLAASGIYNENQPDLKLKGTIIKLDVQKLGFYAEPMILAGKIEGDFSNLMPDELNGTLMIKDFAFSDTKEVFPVQDITLTAVSTPEQNRLELNSQIADVELSGKYKLTQIFGALQKTLNQYYQFQKPDIKTVVDSGQYFTFNAKIKDDDLIRKFVPELKSFETITLTGNYDADSGKIEIDGQMPQVLYGSNAIEAVSLNISNENQALQFNLDAGSVKSESFALNKININGDVAENLINYNVTIKDEKDTPQFLVAGTAKSLDNLTEISLNSNGLKLNYNDWTVNPENKIQISEGGILADNFRLNNGNSEISLQSESNSPNSPLNISLKDFKIETLTEIIKSDSLIAKGTINGTAQIRDLQKNMTFTSGLNVSELEVFGNPVGNLDLKVESSTPGLMNADIALSGNNNDVKLDGTYNTASGGFDLNMAINRLEMQSVQGFSMNAVTNTEGYLSGNLKISGTADNPDILGKVKFNDVGLLVAQTGSDFRKINDAIDFTGRGIEFNRFKINDKDGNSMTVNGQILTKTYRDFAFNLDVGARDFNVVNSEQNADAMMYGQLAIDARLRIRGDLNLPKVDGRISVTDNTNFTFVLPQTAPTLQEREGIVEFIDQDQPVLMGTLKTDSLSSKSQIKGMDVSVNIEVNREAKMSIIIDKANGDFVELQGEAELTGGIDPSGKTTLVGVYEVEKGAYELSVSLVKRKFDIEKGSTITWTGEPMAAILDITAVYKTNVPPIDLVQQQISGYSSAEINMYKQRIPFNALLKLKGELMKPEISFDITTDDDNVSVATNVMDNVKAKLNQLQTDEAERNKQVFALLLLNRFIGENPFQSEAGLSAGTMARQSVSAILSQQLNNLASGLINGVDLNFGFDSVDDYTSGSKNTRTDMNVDISKRLLDDRLKVSIGSNFGLEGDARQNEQMTNIAGDVTVDYSLSKDGRYMLRAYRKNEYQVALQGQIIETGLGFIITLDYDKFREIFERSKKNQIRRKSQNISEK